MQFERMPTWSGSFRDEQHLCERTADYERVTPELDRKIIEDFHSKTLFSLSVVRSNIHSRERGGTYFVNRGPWNFFLRRPTRSATKFDDLALRNFSSRLKHTL